MREVLTAVLRDSLRMDVLGALDYAESVHRGLAKTRPGQIGMDAGDLALMRSFCEDAYNALCRARQVLDDAA